MRSCLSHPIIQCILSTIRWIPVLFVVAIVCWAYYAYVFELCFFTVDSIIERIIYLTGFHLFLILFLFSYYQTIFTQLGRPPSNFYVSREVRHELEMSENDIESRQIIERYVRHQQLPINTRAFDGSIRYCPKCACIKPDRCHHCSICGCCILKFDHHCPWVNTCVNFRNYKYFIQFLGYALIFCLWGFLTDLQYFIDFWKGGAGQRQVGRFHILFLFFVSGMFAISVACLFFYHLFLTAKNQSTIESFRSPIFTYGIDKNGYNIGIVGNYRQVFGVNRLLWFLPIFSSIGNGVAYPMRTLIAESQSLLSCGRNSASDDDEMGGDDHQRTQSNSLALL